MKKSAEEKALWSAANSGDLTARAALADFIAERAETKGQKELTVGLRFCVKYKKWPMFAAEFVQPELNLHKWWNSSLLDRVWSIPREIFASDLMVAKHREVDVLIRSIGRVLLKMRKWTEAVCD